MRDRKYIISLERGLKILEIFGESARRLTLTEVASASSLNKTAAQRFLHTLCTLGYLTRDENKKYQLSTKILSLGFSFLNSSDLRSVCKPHIDTLSSEINRTVNLGVLDGFEVIYLYRKEVTRYLKYDLYAGSRLPAYCVSIGKILLAGLKDDDLKDRIDRMTLNPITRKTVTSKQKLWDEIMQTRKRGYSICDRQLSMDLYSMAVPLINDQQDVIAAVNVTMDPRESEMEIKRKIAGKLINTGLSLSKILGYHGPYPKY
jgi:IclR family pca regulon transcriptional regulator